MFWCHIRNVSVVNLNKYLPSGMMTFQLKKLYLILRTEIVLCWGSKIIINFSNRQIPQPDPGILLHLRQSAYDNEEALKALKKALEGPSRISAILHIIVNNSINQGLRSATKYLLKVSNTITKTLKLDTRTVSSYVNFILFYWLWRSLNITIIYLDETYMWNNSF